METKACVKCKKVLPLTSASFQPDKRYKSGYGSYCKNCKLANKRELYKNDPVYRENHLNDYRLRYHNDESFRNRRIASGRESRKRAKQKVFMHYSNGEPKCACCGEANLQFLTIDHINNDGAAHRKSLGKSYRAGVSMAQWLIRNNFPSGFQILCYNCNCAKGFFGVCPHVAQREGSQSGHPS